MRVSIGNTVITSQGNYGKVIDRFKKIGISEWFIRVRTHDGRIIVLPEWKAHRIQNF